MVGHVLVQTDERRVVRHTEAQDLAHAVFLLAVRVVGATLGSRIGLVNIGGGRAL